MPITPETREFKAIQLEIDICSEFDGWGGCDFDVGNTVEKAVERSLEQCGQRALLAEKSIEISVVLADDEFVRRLNRDYRNKDKPTNVLSFPQEDFSGNVDIGDIVTLGDIILAYETLEREAKELEKPLEHHFTHLVVHGTLHLLGYDHENDADAEEMEGLEVKILSAMGIENPYSDSNFMA